jgi:hypothetical protein
VPLREPSLGHQDTSESFEGVTDMPTIESRRYFLAALAGGAAGLIGAPLVTRRSFAEEPPPETTTIRLPKAIPSVMRRKASPRTCCGKKASPISGLSASRDD